MKHECVRQTTIVRPRYTERCVAINEIAQLREAIAPHNNTLRPHHILIYFPNSFYDIVILQ